jgi:hypothetical protein
MTQERLDIAALGIERAEFAPEVRPGLLDRLRARRRTWLAIRGFREFVVCGAVYVMYDFTRYLIEGDHDAAFKHGRDLLTFENNWHLNPEHTLNNVFTAHWALGVPADYIYATLHYIVTPWVLIWLWRRYPASYSNARSVIIATTIVGLAGFMLYPVAPPRLLGGFQDTMAHFQHWGWWSNAGSAPRGFGSDTNQFAAMPSLHVGWALWAGYQLVRHGQHRVTRWLGALYPLVLSVVVMATANHYLIDVVAGVAVVGIGAVLGYYFTRLTRRIWPDHVPIAMQGAVASHAGTATST